HFVKSGMWRQTSRSAALIASRVPLAAPTVGTPTRCQEGTELTHSSKIWAPSASAAAKAAATYSRREARSVSTAIVSPAVTAQSSSSARNSAASFAGFRICGRTAVLLRPPPPPGGWGRGAKGRRPSKSRVGGRSRTNQLVAAQHRQDRLALGLGRRGQR